MTQFFGKCIFCGGVGLTKEHIWPDWLANVLGPSISPRHVYSAGGGLRPRRFRRRTGAIQSQKLRIVCDRCNNGWMSRLQNRAKPRLIPFIQGRYRFLSDHDARTLAAWSMMLTMVIEFLDPATAATTPDERRQLSELAIPNDKWMVWFGRAQQWPRWSFCHYGWFHISGIESDALTGRQLGPRISPNCNCQTTSVRVGGLLMHAYSARNSPAHVDPNAFSRKHGLRLIWPLSSLGNELHRTKNLSVAQVVNVAWDLMGRITPEYPKPYTIRELPRPLAPILTRLNRELERAGTTDRAILLR